MKKKVLISLIIVFSVIVLGVISFVIRYEYYHGGSPSGKGWYADETVEDNGEFVLKTNLFEGDDIEFMSFCIENEKGEIVFDSEGGWRTWDLHGIKFIDNSNDVVVDTGDVGEIIFEYNGVTWVCEDDFVEETVIEETNNPWDSWH